MRVAGTGQPLGIGRARGRRRAASRGLALAVAAACLAVGCAVPLPQVTPYTVNRVPGESIIAARVQIPEALSGVAGPVERDAVRVTIQAEGGQSVRPTPLSPAGYLLASLPPGRYRVTGWESRAARATRFGPLDVPFEVPLPDRSYYLGTLSLLPRTTERYRLQVDDQFDEAMRYLAAEHPHLAGTYERHLLTVPVRQESPAAPPQ